MNYWPAETTHLGELHRPLFDLIRLFQPSGKEMARRLGMPGWCMGHSTDIWGHARLMGGKPCWAGSFFGGQWMTFHILEHYRFNRDPQVLEDNWDILTASVEFVDAWPDGHVRGLRARGDYAVDLYWGRGELVNAVVHPGKRAGQSVRVTYRDRSVDLDTVAGEAAILTTKSFAGSAPEAIRRP